MLLHTELYVPVCRFSKCPLPGKDFVAVLGRKDYADVVETWPCTSRFLRLASRQGDHRGLVLVRIGGTYNPFALLGVFEPLVTRPREATTFSCSGSLTVFTHASHVTKFSIPRINNTM